MRFAMVVVFVAVIPGACLVAPVSGAAAEEGGASASDRPSRPNIVWISAEDISASTLACYGGQAHTPQIDALASRGILFEKAYSAAPVCAPSRSAIITAVMPTTIGSTPMRCQATPPVFLVGFPRLLRDAGYFCTNNAKTDYNLARSFDVGWDASNGKAHWRNRPERTRPFFSVFNFGVSHESGLFAKPEERAKRRESLPPAARRDPAGIRVPPYYPDTPKVREELAHRLELAALLDRDVGRVLDELDRDGLTDDTIVFFWGDHGEGIPRGKRSLTELGLRVPLIVQVPEKFRRVALLSPGRPVAPGTRSSALVSLLDLGPSVLDLTGVAIPPWMEGQSFLGPHAAPAEARSIVIGVRDRMDDREGLGRGATDVRYRYVRNLMPWIAGDDLPAYADGVAITLELRGAAQAGLLAPQAEWFVRKSRPPEELYDLSSDPDEVVNLANDPAHAATLARFREACVAWMRRTGDTGVLPEGIMRREARAVGSEQAIFHPPSGDVAASVRYERLREAMFAAGEAGPLERFVPMLADDDAAMRFWGACGTGWSGVSAVEEHAKRGAALMLLPVCRDADPIVAVAAGRWLVELGHDDVSVAAGTDVLLQKIGSVDADVRQAALVAVDRLLSLGRFGPEADRLIAAVAAIEPADGEQCAIRIKKRITGRRATGSDVPRGRPEAPSAGG